MTIKILTVCASLALVGCASHDKGGTNGDVNRTQGSDSQSLTNGSTTSTNTTNNIPHQGQGSETQTAPQNATPSSGNRPL